MHDNLTFQLNLVGNKYTVSPVKAFVTLLTSNSLPRKTVYMYTGD